MSAASTASVYSILLGHLGDPAVRSLLLACLAALALKLARIHDAAARLAIWKGILYAALAMPLLAALLPGLPLPLPEFLASRRAETAPPPQSFHFVKRAPAQANYTSQVVIVPGTPAARRERTALAWPTILAAVYLLGAAFLLARFGLGVFFSGRLRRSCRRITEAGALALLKQLAAAASLRSTPELAESKAVAVPVALGVRQPIILLPTAWRDWEEPKLRAVLVHEVSHVARKDARTQMLAALHRCVFWFSPLSWWLERHLAELAEQASDDAALHAVTDRTYYAEILIGFLAAVEGARGRIHLQGVSMAKGSRVERRVDHILSAQAGLLRGIRKPIGVGVLLAAMPITFLVAAVRLEQGAAVPSGAARSAPAAPQVLAVPDYAVSSSGAFTLMASAAVGQQPPAPPATPAKPAIAARPNSPQAPKAPKAPKAPFRWNRNDNEDEDGEAYVIVSGDSISMSGGPRDMRHAKSLQEKITGDYIWFRRDDKGYVIRDAATVRQAKQLFAPQEALGRQQEELGKKQEELGHQQEALGQKMEEVRIKVPDLTAELKRVEQQLAKLHDGGTMEQLGDVQEALGELQGRLGELQGHAGEAQGKLGEQMGALGEKQGELGEQQGRLGEEQGRLAREATRKMRTLLDDAFKKGLAQPE